MATAAADSGTACDPAAQLRSLVQLLSAANIEHVATKLCELYADNLAAVDSLADAFLEAALKDVLLQGLYAQLCKRLSDGESALLASRLRLKLVDDGAPVSAGWYYAILGSDDWQGPQRSEAEATAAAVYRYSFRRLLLNRVQHEFFSSRECGSDALAAEAAADARFRASKQRRGELLTPEEERELAGRAAQREGVRLAARCNMTATVAFIGHLFQLRLLTPKAVHFCADGLLAGGQLQHTDDDSVEALCLLLLLTGRKLAADDATGAPSAAAASGAAAHTSSASSGAGASPSSGSHAPGPGAGSHAAGPGLLKLPVYMAMLEKLGSAAGSHLSSSAKAAVRGLLDVHHAGWNVDSCRDSGCRWSWS